MSDLILEYGSGETTLENPLPDGATFAVAPGAVLIVNGKRVAGPAEGKFRKGKPVTSRKKWRGGEHAPWGHEDAPRDVWEQQRDAKARERVEQDRLVVEDETLAETDD